MFLKMMVLLGVAAALYLAYREFKDRQIAKAQLLEEEDSLSVVYLNRPARVAYYRRMASLKRLEGAMGTAASYERLADLVGVQERALP